MCKLLHVRNLGAETSNVHIKCLKHTHNASDIGNTLGHSKILEFLKTLLAGRDKDLTMRVACMESPQKVTLVETWAFLSENFQFLLTAFCNRTDPFM